MSVTVFFSWQLDTPTIIGRNFIERSLERAIEAIASDIELEEAIRDGIEVDRDTKGVPGSPPIVDTIFQKIDSAAVFVPDLTFVCKRPDGRPSPNPNVLIEYGWALKSLSHARIVPIMNVAYGEPSAENMPFDLRHLRNPILFNLPPDASEEQRIKERQKLTSIVKDAIRTVLASTRQGKAQTQIPKFSERPSLGGPARFRSENDILGYSENFPSGTAHGVSLAGGSAIWLRVMPEYETGKTFKTNILKQAMTNGSFVMPLFGQNWSSYNYLRGEDGFGIYAINHNDPDKTHSLVYCFNTGEVWGIDTYMLPNLNDQIPYIEVEMVSAATRYSALLERLEIKRPHRWIAGMENLKGKSITFPTQPLHFLPGGRGGICVQDTILSGGTIETESTILDSLRPFFETIFDKCGIERSPHLDTLIKDRLAT